MLLKSRQTVFCNYKDVFVHFLSICSIFNSSLVSEIESYNNAIIELATSSRSKTIDTDKYFNNHDKDKGQSHNSSASWNFQ